MLNIKEWNLDNLMFSYVWSPFKWLGKQLRFLQSGLFIGLLTIAAIVFLIIGYADPEMIAVPGQTLPILLMTLALVVILFAFSCRQSALKAWVYLLTGHIFIIAAVLFNADHVDTIEIVFYASGVILAFLLGYYCLH